MAEMKIADLTLEEFRALIREAVTESLADLFADPDEGLELREEFEGELKRSVERRIAGHQETESLQDVLVELGLE